MLRKSAGSLFSPFNSKVILQSSLQMMMVIAIIISVLGLALNSHPAQAAQSFQPLYYLAVPEDDALQAFRDSGGAIAVSPIRSVTSIAIGDDRHRHLLRSLGRWLCREYPA